MTEPRKDYIPWDECFMQIAKVIAKRSKDPSTQVGAVIVNSENVVYGLGYNGFPRGIKSEDLPWDREGGVLETKYAYVCHAEENAIYNSNGSVKGCKIYCSLFPCNECTKALIQNGIVEVVYEGDKHHDLDIYKAARKMLDLAGIKYRQYNSKD